LSVRIPLRWCTTSPRKSDRPGAWPSQNDAPPPVSYRLLSAEVRAEWARSGIRD
jgi:hypothetical protein